MSNRPGQDGTVVLKNGQWRGRYLEDVPGQYERVYRSVYLAPAQGPNKITKTDARKLLDEIILKRGINLAEHLNKALSPVEVQTFKQKAKWWEDNKAVFFKPATLLTMQGQLQNHVFPAIGHLPADHVNETVVQELVSKLHKSGLAPKTIANIVGLVKLVLGEKVWRDWQLKLPEKLRQEQSYFTQEQMELIIQKAPERYKALLCVLAGTGCRIGEAVGLHVDDLDLVNNTITIRRSVWRGQEQAPKTSNAYRRVHIDPSLSAILQHHLEGKTSGRVFESRNGTPLDANSISKRILKPLLKKLGIEGSFHSFRHGRVSILQQNGVPGDLIREWVGHSTLQMSSNYTHFNDSFRQGIVAKLGLSPTLSPTKEAALLAAS
jgi:integrase